MISGRLISDDPEHLAARIREGMAQRAWDFVAYASVQLMRQTSRAQVGFEPMRIPTHGRLWSFAADALRFARQHRAMRNGGDA